MIHFSEILFQEKLNTYHFDIFHIPEVRIAIVKNVITVIIHNTKVVFRSLFIGLTKGNIFGDIEAQSQSINKPKRFQKRIIIKNQATRGKNALENFLS